MIRKGYESVTVIREDGTTLSGLLIEDRSDALVIRDASAGGESVIIPKSEIEEHKLETISMMPTGLMNQFTDRQQFLDLAAFLFECAEFGPARARSLRPDPAVIDPPLPTYETDLDHAKLIAQLDAAGVGKRQVALFAALRQLSRHTL